MALSNSYYRNRIEGLF